MSSWKFALTSRRLRGKFCLSWSARATRNTSHDSWSRFHMHVVSFEKSPLQICWVLRRIWCLLSAPVSRPCWNRKCESTRGDKHSCCATPNVHAATPLGMLSGDVPCSQARRTHSCTAIGWRSMEQVSKLFDTPSYKSGPSNAFCFVWQLRCCTSLPSQFLMFLLIILYTVFLNFPLPAVSHNIISFFIESYLCFICPKYLNLLNVAKVSRECLGIIWLVTDAFIFLTVCGIINFSLIYFLLHPYSIAGKTVVYSSLNLCWLNLPSPLWSLSNVPFLLCSSLFFSCSLHWWWESPKTCGLLLCCFLHHLKMFTFSTLLITVVFSRFKLRPTLSMVFDSFDHFSHVICVFKY